MNNKRIKKLLSILLTAVLLTVMVSTTAVGAINIDKEDEHYADLAYNYIQNFDNNYIQRYSSSQNELNAANYIKSELDSFGYDAYLQPFEFNLNSQDYKSQNVVATKKGEDSSKRIVLGAHYDSVQQTHGVDDNASGVALMLSYAKRIAQRDEQYDIDIVLFGSEELGMKGSKAYVDSLTQDEKDSIIVMINADCVFAGEYCYVYGGVPNSYGKAKDTWGVELAKEIADEDGLDVRLNDTDISAVQTPTGVKHSDQASFEDAGIPYIYFEATTWEMPDDPNNPQKGSTGTYETEIGRVMHDEQRDNLDFIENQFKERPKENLTTYTILLDDVVNRINPSMAQQNNNVQYVIIIISSLIIFVLIVIIVIKLIRKRKNN